MEPTIVTLATDALTVAESSTANGELARLLESRLGSPILQFQVTDDETARLATETGVIVQRIEKLVEDERKHQVKPLNDKVKEINARFAAVTTILSDAKNVLKNRILTYQGEKRKRAEEEEARRQKVLEEIRQKELAEAAAKGITAPAVALELPPEELATSVKSDSGMAVGQKRWTFEITNPMAVPATYCSPDERKIREAVSSGVREISGVRIYEKEGVSFR